MIVELWYNLHWGLYYTSWSSLAIVSINYEQCRIIPNQFYSQFVIHPVCLASYVMQIFFLKKQSQTQPCCLHACWWFAYLTSLLSNVHVISVFFFFVYVDMFLDLVAKCISYSLSRFAMDRLRYGLFIFLPPSHITYYFHFH